MELLYGIGAVVVVGVLLLSIELSRRAKVRRALRKATRTAIADVPARGLCKIVGRVEYEAETLSAPMTGRACAAYELEVSVHAGGEFSQVAEERTAVPFRVVDDTGHAIVDPGRSRVAIALDESVRLTTRNSLQAAFLRRHHLESTGDYFYREGIIEAGEEVAVLGYASREPDPEGAPDGLYRGAPPTRVRIVGSSKRPVLISDIPRTREPVDRTTVNRR